MLDSNSLKGQKEIHSNEWPQEINNKYYDLLNPDVQSSTRLKSNLTNDLNKLTGFETEKRRYTRIQTQHEVSCTFYDSLKDDFEVIDAQVENKSPGGLLLTTDMPLEIGMPVLVRLKHYSETDGDDDLKDGIHARVMRCDKIFVTEKESCYRVAIEHFELCQ